MGKTYRRDNFRRKPKAKSKKNRLATKKELREVLDAPGPMAQHRNRA